MSSKNSVEETINYSLFRQKKSSALGEIQKKAYVSYKLALFLVDVLLICLAFVLGAWVSDYQFNLSTNLQQSIILISFSMIAGSFFLTYDLYNYHLIFFIKSHIRNLALALIWSMLTALTIILIYSWLQIINHIFSIPILLLVAIVIVLISRFFYSQLLNILKVLGISFLATGFFSLINPETVPEIITNRLVIPLGYLLTVVALVSGRIFLVHLVFNVWMRRQLRRQVIIVGLDKKAVQICNHVIKYNTPFWIDGIVGPQPGITLESKVPKISFGELKDLPDIVVKQNIDDVIVTDDKIDKPTLISIIDFCTSVGIAVWFAPNLMPIIDIKLYIDNFCGIRMIRMNPTKHNWLFNKIKHSMDAILTIPFFILSLPLFLMIGIAIKINSKGPVLYKPQAVGKGARFFNLYKFRSMRVDSDKGIHQEYVTKLIKGEISEEDGEDKPLKITDDPRVTKVGKIIRKFSLDELPQLINVIKGDMSLVGPRPCLPYEYEIYKDWHKKRTGVRPGITGLWQVAGRSAVSFDDMILLDLYYIYNHNMAIDFNTLYETIFVVLGKKGAY